MNKLNFRCAVLCSALLLTSLPALAQDSGAEEDPTIATVNGEAILRSDVLTAAGELPAQYQAQIPQILPLLVERLIDTRLISAAANEAGLADDEEVGERLEAQKSVIMREVYLERQVGDRMSDEALRSRYDSFLEENPPAVEVSARHILVEEETEAKDIITELDGGADFAELAQSRSIGPSSSEGGSLGFFTKEEMVPEFSEAAFALEDGAYTGEPVQTQFGWHVIKTEERRTKEPTSFEEMQGQLQEELARQALSDMVADLRGDATIETFLDRLVPTEQ